VLQRSGSALGLVLLLGGLASSPPLPSQTALPEDNARNVFKANARIVVLDVVVTGMKGRPVGGLHKQDFLISEDGRPQTISYFEEHTGAQQANVPDLPPNVFTNVPRVKPNDSETVLLLDSLNTPLADQSNVRAQMIRYLKKQQSGRRMAIFTLGTRLRLVQGFTDDPALLTAAINNQKNGTGLQTAPLLQTDSETAANQELVAAMAEHAPDAAADWQQFMADQSSTRDSVRIDLTLAAFQELAHYLAGIPGRKNVAWFSGAFPVVIFPNPALSDSFAVQADDQEKVRKTDALLSSVQVAIYPIATEGVATDSLYSASSDTRGAQQRVSNSPQEDAQQRNANHAGMDEIARDTGGAAFYGTNSLSDALARITDHGSYFYTLTYTSTNLATDGRFRKIQVKLPGGYQPAYRRGYYADDAKSIQAAAAAKPAPKPAADPLSPFLRPGLPDATQVPLTLRVMRGSAQPGTSHALTSGNQPATNPGQGGDNPNLKGPLTRYKVDLMIPARGLQFEPAPDGRRHVSVEAALVVYNHEGTPLNWMLRQVNLNLDAAHYTTAQANGVNLYLEIDAPDDGALLRSGVYDLNTNLAGTLEIPLSTIVSGDPTGSSR
jgi:VWFA-related protein